MSATVSRTDRIRRRLARRTSAPNARPAGAARGVGEFRGRLARRVVRRHGRRGRGPPLRREVRHPGPCDRGGRRPLGHLLAGWSESGGRWLPHGQATLSGNSGGATSPPSRPTSAVLAWVAAATGPPRSGRSYRQQVRNFPTRAFAGRNDQGDRPPPSRWDVMARHSQRVPPA